MNKTFLNLLVVFSLCSGSYALAEEGTLEIRSAAFIPSSQRFSKVYGDVGVAFGIEASQRFCDSYRGWIDLDFFPKSKSDGKCCKSRINIYNASCGINYIIPISCSVQAYIGIGPSFSRVNIKNHTCYRKEHISRFVVGGIIKSGVCFNFYDPFYINVFVDYLYLPVHFHRTVDLGGTKVGAGLGIRF